MPVCFINIYRVTFCTSKFIDHTRLEESVTLTKFLILKQENANMIPRLLQYLLSNVRTLRWAKLENRRNDNLK